MHDRERPAKSAASLRVGELDEVGARRVEKLTRRVTDSQLAQEVTGAW